MLLRSMARAYGAQAVGVVMTGMGIDGADGLLSLKAAGGQTLAQDEASSVVYGMPREAAMIGAALTVGVPNTFNKEYLERKIPHLIQKAMQAIGHSEVELQFAVVPGKGSGQAPTPKSHGQGRGGRTFGNGAAPVYPAPPPFFAGQSAQLNSRYVFETFIQGGGNRFAYAAAMS